MNKTILYYCAVIYLFTFMITLVSIFQHVKLDLVVLCMYSFFGCFALYFVSKEKHMAISLYFLVVTHLLQSIRVVYSGAAYHFVEGFNIYGNVSNEEGDVISRFSIVPISFDFQIDSIADTEVFLFGINFIQLGLFVYFLRLLGRYEKPGNHGF